jgi:hypothetical protein
LAEVPASEPSSKEDAARRLKEGLAFDHRIADTRRVDSREISLTGYRRARIRTLIVMLAVNAVLAGIGLGIGAWLEDPTQEGELQFWLVANDSKSVLVTVQPLADGNLRLKGVNEKFNATMPVEAFFLRHKWKPIIAKRYGGIVVTVMMAVILVLSATMAGYFWMTIRREARLKYILALSSPKEQEQASA